MKSIREKLRGWGPAEWFAAAAVAFSLGWLFFSVLPLYFRFAGDRFVGSLDRVRAHLDFQKSIAAALAGAGGAIALYFAWRRIQATDEQNRIAREAFAKQEEDRKEQNRLVEQGNVTERFTRAIEMLGTMRQSAKGFEPNLEVRLGGLYALERLAKDSPTDYPTVVKILCAYVRENAPWTGAKQIETSQAIADAFSAGAVRLKSFRVPLAGHLPDWKPRIDVQTALTVLASKDWCRAEANEEDRPTMDLSGTDLRLAQLSGAHFEGSFLVGTHLEVANLHSASLKGAVLGESHLIGADLGKAQLNDVDLEEAHLESADLSGAKGLEYYQIALAYGNRRTQLPEGLTWPVYWLEKSDDMNSEKGSQKGESVSAAGDAMGGESVAKGDEVSGREKESPGEEKGSPGGEKESLGWENGSPGGETESLGREKGSPGGEKESLGWENGSPGLEKESPGREKGSAGGEKGGRGRGKGSLKEKKGPSRRGIKAPKAK